MTRDHRRLLLELLAVVAGGAVLAVVACEAVRWLLS